MERQAANQKAASAQTQAAYHELTSHGLEGFWLLDENTINRVLAALLGNHRLVILEGAIARIAPKTAPRV